MVQIARRRYEELQINARNYAKFGQFLQSTTWHLPEVRSTFCMIAVFVTGNDFHVH